MTEPRYAVVVIVSEYHTPRRLLHAPNTLALPELLGNANFEVTDLSKSPEKAAVVQGIAPVRERVNSQFKPKPLVLFTFSGHGADGDNLEQYMVCSDYNRGGVQGLGGLEEHSYQLRSIIDDLAEAGRVLIVIDACRDRDHLEANPTLRLPSTVPRNVWVVQSCAPGGIAWSGTNAFMAHLAQELTVTGQELTCAIDTACDAVEFARGFSQRPQMRLGRSELFRGLVLCPCPQVPSLPQHRSREEASVPAPTVPAPIAPASQRGRAEQDFGNDATYVMLDPTVTQAPKLLEKRAKHLLFRLLSGLKAVAASTQSVVLRVKGVEEDVDVLPLAAGLQAGMPAREVRVQTQSQAYRCFENNGRQEQESSPLRSTIEITCVSLAESLGLRVWGKRLVGRGVPDAVIWFVTSERAFTLQVVSKQAAATAQDDDCIELEEACLPLGGVVLEVVKFGCPVLGWSLTAEEVQELEIDAGRLVRADYPPLFLAALQGDLSEVDKLISHGADINAPCRDSRTALCVAAARGDLNMVMVMVSHGAQVDIADRYGRTPLYVAARYAHEAVVEYLTKSGANVDQADTYGWTPLYAAAQAGNLSVVTVLQQAGADQDRASHCGWTPLYVAKQNGLDAIVDQLMKASSRRGRSHRDPGEEIVPADEHTINMEPQPSSSRHTTSQKDSQGSTAEYVKAAQPFVDKVLGLEQGLKQYSDLTSTDNNGKTIQWVDIVMAGGGMLGIAHVGATYVFERAGLRFHSIGGASAGAINAALVVTKRGPRPDAESSLETLKTMAALDFKEFQDDKDGQALLKDFREDNADGTLSFWEQAKLLVFHVGAIMRAISRQGLHSGKYFENWITKEMTNGGITNVDQLNDRLNVDLNSVRSLQLREGRVQNLSEDESKALLNDVGAGKMVIIASDITTATKAQFPENAKLYFNQPGRVHPGIFVRASMAVPGFFAPVVLPNATSGDLPTGATAEQAWKDDVGFEPTLETPGKPRFPNKIKFVDGGVLSNFPINAFHNKDRVPVLPTFGVCFGTSRTAVSASYTESNGILNFLGAIFDSSRQILDRDFLLKNPDYRQLITTIDASGFDWLDFDLSETRKVELFAQGAKAAAEFLVSFDWEKYKKTREFLLQARQAGSNLSNKIP